jgi:hypothetical protein
MTWGPPHAQPLVNPYQAKLLTNGQVPILIMRGSRKEIKKARNIWRTRWLKGRSGLDTRGRPKRGWDQNHIGGHLRKQEAEGLTTWVPNAAYTKKKKSNHCKLIWIFGCPGLTGHLPGQPNPRAGDTKSVIHVMNFFCFPMIRRQYCHGWPVFDTLSRSKHP